MSFATATWGQIVEQINRMRAGTSALSLQLLAARKKRSQIAKRIIQLKTDEVVGKVARLWSVLKRSTRVWTELRYWQSCLFLTTWDLSCGSGPSRQQQVSTVSRISVCSGLLRCGKNLCANSRRWWKSVHVHPGARRLNIRVENVFWRCE